MLLPRSSAVLLGCALLSAHATGQSLYSATQFCRPVNAIEFISPMPTEEVPVFHTAVPQSWQIVLELALDQRPPVLSTPVFEVQTIPSPGIAAPQPTDVNGDGVLGDPHPAIPGLVLVTDDIVIVNGQPLPPGTNLASFVEQIGSEVEHGAGQSTTLTWIVDPQFMWTDANGDMGSQLTASIAGVQDTVFFRHGTDPVYQPCSLPSTPTVSIWTSDWISTIDNDVLSSDLQTAWSVGVEVRIPCFWDTSTTPATPIALDPLVGPAPGFLPFTGNSPNVPGPGFHPGYPSLYVTFSDDYFDIATGSFAQGGVVTGGTCATIYGTTGANLAFAFEQSSVAAWYGVDGVMNSADDQLIYRFTMLVDGQIFDTDALQDEMLITASIETECNLFSITNVRVKHVPDVETPNPE